MSTAYVKHMPMATTIRQDPTRPGSNLLMLIAAISHGAQENHGGGTLGTWHRWHRWHRAKHAAGGVNIGNDLDGIWGWKPTNWVVHTVHGGKLSQIRKFITYTWMCEVYSKYFGGGSEIYFLTSHTMILKRPSMKPFNERNLHAWSSEKQQNNKVFNPSNGIQINISQTFCFVNLPTEKVFKNFGYMSFN